jgi:hypothetical protein
MTNPNHKDQAQTNLLNLHLLKAALSIRYNEEICGRKTNEAVVPG